MRYSVLLVEDESALRELFSSVLSNAGHSVLVAEDGKKALDIVDGINGLPFVLLTDVVLPGMNGHELAKHVLRLRAKTKVGFITGWFDQKLVQLGKCSDCRCVLRKPFTNSELVNFVARIASQDVCQGLSDQPKSREAYLEQRAR